MPNYRDAFRGAVGGAGLGAGLTATGIGAPLGIPLAALGAVGGFFTGLFGDSEEDIRRERIQTLLKSIEENRTKRLTEGRKEIGKYTSGLRENEFARGERIARASGREGEARTLSLPGTALIAREGNKAIGRFENETNAAFDQMKLGVEYDRASEPIQPGAVDYLESLGSLGAEFGAMKDLQGVSEKAMTDEQVRLGAFKNFRGEAELPEVVEPYQGPVYDPEKRKAYAGLRRNQPIMESNWFGKLRRQSPAFQ